MKIPSGASFRCQFCGNVAHAGTQACGSESGDSEGGPVSVDWTDTLSQWSSSDSDEQPPPGPGSVEAQPSWDEHTSGIDPHPHLDPLLTLIPTLTTLRCIVYILAATNFESDSAS